MKSLVHDLLHLHRLCASHTAYIALLDSSPSSKLSQSALRGRIIPRISCSDLSAAHDSLVALLLHNMQPPLLNNPMSARAYKITTENELANSSRIRKTPLQAAIRLSLVHHKSRHLNLAKPVHRNEVCSIILYNSLTRQSTLPLNQFQTISIRPPSIERHSLMLSSTPMHASEMRGSFCSRTIFSNDNSLCAESVMGSHWCKSAARSALAEP